MRPLDATLGLTQERLKGLLSYDPDTGVFIWLASKSRRVKNGMRADRISKSTGYRVLKIGDRVFFCHRLAWLYMTGVWPENRIDHINLDRADCRWSNLRPATSGQNVCNRRAAKNIKSGLKGAYRIHGTAFRKKPWKSVINLGGKIKHLGTFTTPEEANAAYAKAANEHFGAFARSA